MNRRITLSAFAFGGFSMGLVSTMGLFSVTHADGVDPGGTLPVNNCSSADACGVAGCFDLLTTSVSRVMSNKKGCLSETSTPCNPISCTVNFYYGKGCQRFNESQSAQMKTCE